MLTEVFPKLKLHPLVRSLRCYFRSFWHIGVVAALMACASLFSLELPVYYLYFILAVLAFLFAEDMLPLVPMVCCAPMTFSVPNNPLLYPETTILADTASLAQIGFILAVVVVLMIARLITMNLRAPKKGVPALAVGFVLLILAYLLGGAFTEYYGKDTIVIGLCQSAAICLFYFYFYYTVNWKNVKSGYGAALLLMIGCVLALQSCGMYLREGVVVDGVVYRNKLLVGWGQYNLLGCVLAMSIPAAFYFAVADRNGWIYTILATVLMLAVLLTQSRGSILFGGVIYAASAVVTVVKSKKNERIFHLIVLGVVLVTAIVCAFVYQEVFENFFKGLFLVGMDDNGRIEIFKQMWEYFLGHAGFGVGWVGDPNLKGHYYPGYIMAHNTVLQVLGCFGVFGAAAYLFHRVQTGVILFRHLTFEKAFLGLSIGALLLTCMLDCHIYSIGPAMLYSVVLVFIEGVNRRDGVPPLFKGFKKERKAQTE